MYTFFRFRDKLYWHVSVLCICDLLPLSRSMQNIRSCSMFIRCFLRKVHRQSYDHALRGSQQFPHHMTIFPPLLGRPRLLPRPVNPFTLKSDLIDFTLSNARRFYSSKGDPLGVKGLTHLSGNTLWQAFIFLIIKLKLPSYAEGYWWLSRRIGCCWFVVSNRNWLSPQVCWRTCLAPTPSRSTPRAQYWY